MLHAHAQHPFNPAIFREPPAICRGAPFWSWNGRLDRARLFRQLATFRRMGLGGGHMHVRTGLESPAYLSDAFLALVRDCCDEAERLGLLAWLYDEDRWPSGFAGGLVTADERFRARYLRLTPRACVPGESRPASVHHSAPLPVSERRFLAGWALRLDAAGALQEQQPLADGATPPAGWRALFAYTEIMPASSWFNGGTYVDIFNPEATRRFIAVTHERYAAALGDRLGRSVPAIFTDEPLFQATSEQLRDAHDPGDVIFAWNDDFPATFRAATGDDLIPLIPALVFDRADGGHAPARLRFHDHRTERMAQAYGDQLGTWCAQHGIALTGHLMEEPTPERAANWVGEAMRHYRSFQVPGIDLLCDALEFTTAKQAQSAARQYGREGVMSELYGVTNWDFPFAGHKRQGDWQAALGIILRVHHLTWYSMEGEAKRDYPASMGEHAPWHPWYRVVEDHFARLNTVLTRGAPFCRIALIHPHETAWLHRGPRTTHQQRLVEQGRDFTELCAGLLHALIDFDYVAESLLPAQCPQAANPLPVGVMRYGCVVVAQCETIRASTLDRLETFAAAGGDLLFAGAPPALVDGVASDRARRLAERCRRCDSDPRAIANALECWRDLDLRTGDGRRPHGLVHQQRVEADGSRWLFVCNTSNDGAWGSYRLRGAWTATAFDTVTGDSSADPATPRDGWTTFGYGVEAGGHVLYRLQPAAAAPAVAATTGKTAPAPRWRALMPVPAPYAAERHEPNVLVLDRAAWRLDGGAWQPANEVLRIDNLARQQLGLSERTGNLAQPWSQRAEPPTHRVTLRFTVDCAVPATGVRLALERVADARLAVDGRAITARPDGWWVDDDIATVPLGDLAVGTHTIEVEWSISSVLGLEWCHLLIDAGVAIAGDTAQIVALPARPAFGDLTRQGLSFYGANYTWRSRFTAPGGRLRLATGAFDAAAVVVALDGIERGVIAWAPWRLDLGEVAAGDHELAITVLGTRINTFGALHNADRRWQWHGPHAWRTSGDAWSDAWQLKPFGLRGTPMIEMAGG